MRIEKHIIGFLMIAAVSVICVLLSLAMQSRKKINIFVVFFCPITISGILYSILIKQDSTSWGEIAAIGAAAVWFVISFIVSLVTSFVMQLLLLRKRNRDINEMNRRLWLCDKLFNQLQFGGKDQQAVLHECIKNMVVFLDLGRKYFGINAVAEQDILTSYLNLNESANIHTKLNEYKIWLTARELE